MSAIKPVIVFVAILNTCLGVQQKAAAIKEYVNERFDDGGYHFRYLTSDGSEREERGTSHETSGQPILKVSGFYSYIDNYGQTYRVFYQADERGSKIERSTTFPRKPTEASTGSPPPPQHLPPFSAPIPGGTIATLAGGGIGK